MGQIEVYEWLKLQRIKGNDKFFRYRDVYNGLREQGFSCHQININSDLNQLLTYGYLDLKMTGKFSDWQRTFRIKKKYLNI